MLGVFFGVRVRAHRTQKDAHAYTTYITVAQSTCTHMQPYLCRLVGKGLGKLIKWLRET